MSTGGLRLRVICAGLLSGTALLVIGGSAATAASVPVSFTATIDGRDIASSSTSHPLDLAADAPLEVTLEVTNNTGRAITVAGTRFRSEVMGLGLFSYDTQIGLTVTAGSTQRSQFRIGPADITGQALGLLPATIELLGADGAVIAGRSVTVDVDGDVTSTYGVLGLAVVALSLLWLASLVLLLVRGSLPSRRVIRMAQFGSAGLGVGLSATFILSVWSVLTPVAALWLPLVAGGAALGLAVGCLTRGERPVSGDSEQAIVAALTENIIQSGGTVTRRPPAAG